MNDPASQLKNLRERIDSGGMANIRDDDEHAHKSISEADQDVLRSFDDSLSLLSSQYSGHRKVKLLRHMVIMAEEMGGVARSLKDEAAAKDLVRWIHENYDNEETNHDYRIALRVFGRHTTDDNGDEPPESLEWIPSGTANTHDRTPDPTEMLDWHEDVIPMIDATHNTRDEAAIALQFDAGLRGGEFAVLTVGNLTDHDHGLQVSVKGKQGTRAVTLTLAGPHINRWLSDHPAPEDGSVPLWCKLNTPESLSYRMITKMFSEAARRAGVTKPVTLTNFRKSSASDLASKGLNQAHLEDHHGWVRGSRVASRYVAVFAEDAEREIARIRGLDVEEEEPEPTAPIACPRCGEDTPRQRTLCVWCGQALEPLAAEKADRFDDILVESIANAEGGDAETLLDFRNAAKDNPELKADAIAEIAHLLEEH